MSVAAAPSENQVFQRGLARLGDRDDEFDRQGLGAVVHGALAGLAASSGGIDELLRLGCGHVVSRQRGLADECRVAASGWAGGPGATGRVQSGRSFQRPDFGQDRNGDFQVGIDKMVLDQTPFGNIASSDIRIVASDSAAATSTGLVTYSLGSGRLFFNQNGSATGLGTGGPLASVESAPTLSVSDFVIQA